MSTSTFALDGTSYRFNGWGIAPAIYEKGRPLNNYAGNLGSGDLTAYMDALALFSRLRLFVCGGEFYREGASGRNYPAKKQAALLKRLFSTANFGVTLCPFSAPSSCMVESDQTTLRANGTELIVSDDLTTRQNFVVNDTNWQKWLDEIDAQIRMYLRLGANVDALETPNEYGHTTGPANYWQSYLSAANAAAWVNKVWLGTGLTGGGIKARYPWLRLISGFPVDGTGQATIAADGTAGPEVDLWGLNTYDDGVGSTNDAVLGLSGNTGRFGKGVLSEFGPKSATSGATAAASLARTIHQATAYLRCDHAVEWTSLRDVTAKAVTDTRGISYSAKPLMDLTTGSGTFAFRHIWWVMKPFLLAAGRGPVNAYCTTAQDDLDTNANFSPAAGVYASLFKRDDGGYGCVYANISGSTRSDTIHFNIGGGNASLSGTRVDYSPEAGSGNEGSSSGVSTSSGDIALTSLATNKIALLQLAP